MKILEPSVLEGDDDGGFWFSCRCGMKVKLAEHNDRFTTKQGMSYRYFAGRCLMCGTNLALCVEER